MYECGVSDGRLLWSTQAGCTIDDLVVVNERAISVANF